MKIKISVLLLIVILFAHCKEEPDEMPEPNIMDCSIEEIKAAFETEMAKDNFISSVTESSNTYDFLYENGAEIIILKSCFSSVNANEEDWVVNIIYEDGSQQQPRYLGAIGINRNVNPSGLVPLHARLVVYTPVPGRTAVTVVGKNGPDSDVEKVFNDFSNSHLVDVLGLYPNHENIVEVSFLKESGLVRKTDTIHIRTGSIERPIPEIFVDVQKKAKMEPGMNLISYRGSVYEPNMPFMMDNFGDVRWYLDLREHPTLRNMGYDVGLERLQNGNLFFGDWSTNAIHEVSMYGEVVNSWPFPGYWFHHNVIEKPDGNFLVTVSKEGSTHENGNYTVEDFIIEIDRTTGDVITEWDLKESLDENRTALIYTLDNEYIDWFHCNAILYDETDNTIILSGRTQGVVKLDYANNVVWILGPHEGWGDNRRGEDLNQFLLKPLDIDGAEILNSAVANGFQAHPNFEWNWYQHAPHFMPNGNIMLFDNGDNRNFGSSDSYSRAVEYKIDEVNMTVQQTWQYGKERGIETYSRIVSDVDYLQESDNIYFAPGAFVNNGPGIFGAKIVEVDYNSKEVVFEARLNSPGITFHRAERLTLYPN